MAKNESRRSVAGCKTSYRPRTCTDRCAAKCCCRARAFVRLRLANDDGISGARRARFASVRARVRVSLLLILQHGADDRWRCRCSRRRQRRTQTERVRETARASVVVCAVVAVAAARGWWTDEDEGASPRPTSASARAPTRRRGVVPLLIVDPTSLFSCRMSGEGVPSSRLP